MKNGKTSTGMDENLEALLTYVLGWITGIVFLLAEKKSKFVKFHALQSTITFGSISILLIVFGFIPVLGVLIDVLIDIAAVILWILLMIKAYSGEKYKLPIVGDIAEKHA